MVNTPQTFCRDVLPEVSRTFALNIPVLPQPLDFVVTVAYLLCRIADTLEDEAKGSSDRVSGLFDELAALVELPEGWAERAQAFTRRARAAMRKEAPPTEIRLLEGTPLVMEAFASLPRWTHPHIQRCVATMAQGMRDVRAEQAGHETPSGLSDLDGMLAYCYYVAGTVGEMLTGLFIDFSPKVAARAAELQPRAQAFGRALQLTNILKDIREDLVRASCWLPRNMMEAQGLTAETLLLPENRARAVALLDDLVAVARPEADEALEYSLALPPDEPGLRLFCLWPLFFAVETLATLEGNPAVFDAAPVKISRDTVKRIMGLAQERVGSDDGLRALYAECKGGSASAPSRASAP